MATLQELKTLVRQGEHQTLEFKRKIDHPEKVVKEVVAFANSQGGSLLVGVSDNGDISGLRNPEEEAFALNTAIDKFCKPTINYQLIQIPISQKKYVLHYKITKSEVGPHFVNATNSNEAFIRIEDKSVKASREITEIIRQRRKENGVNLRFGVHEKALMQHLEAKGSITVSAYMNISKLPRSSASKKLVLFVLAGILEIIPGEKEDVFVANNLH